MEVFGKYELVEKLARGGMGEVFVARELTAPGRRVALKRIHPHLSQDPDSLTMFLDEASIVARLHHRNIVEIYDLGSEAGSLFIAMELIHGETLRAIALRGVETGRPLPLALACRVAAEVCQGLAFAHARADPVTGKPLGIVHRDVSPQNVLVGFDGTVKLVDFGIAKADDRITVTASGIIKGKHPYLAPEQAAGERADQRTDVFALGIVLYEVVTGRRLFRRDTDLKTLEAVVRCEVAAPSTIAHGVPPELDAALMKALARDREFRFADAAAFGLALERFLGKLPATATSLEALSQWVSELFPEQVAKAARRMPSLYEPLGEQLPTEQLAPPALTEKVRGVDDDAVRAALRARQGTDVSTLPPDDGSFQANFQAALRLPSEVPTRPSRPAVDATLPGKAPAAPPAPARPPDETLPVKPPAVPLSFSRPAAVDATLPGKAPTAPPAPAKAATEALPVKPPAAPLSFSRPPAVDAPRAAGPEFTTRELELSGLPRRRRLSLPWLIALPVAGGLATWGLMNLREAVAPVVATACPSPLSLQQDGGRLLVHSSAPVGTAFRLVAGGSEAPVGVAVVVEALADGTARLITENAEQLPAGVRVCPLAR